MKTAGRPLGARIRQVMEYLEAAGGEAICSQIHKSMPEVDVTNVAKYCRRAAFHGLLTITEGKPMSCRAIPGWRDKADERLERGEAVVAIDDGLAITACAIRTQPNSVFALGSTA